MGSASKYVLAGVTFALVLTAALVGASVTGLLGVRVKTITKYLTSTEVSTVLSTVTSTETKVITKYVITPNSTTSTTTQVSTSTTSPTTGGAKESLEPLVTNASSVGAKVIRSYEELVKLIKESSQESAVTTALIREVGVTPSVSVTITLPTVTVKPLATKVSVMESTGKAVPYSRTNVQVAGVDEPDIVKTDGKYIYLVKGREVLIIKAYPPSDMRVVSKVVIRDGYVRGIFVSNGKLVVIATKYGPVIPRKSKYVTKTITKTVTVVEVEDSKTKTVTQEVPVTVVQPAVIQPPISVVNTSVYVYKLVNGEAKLVGNVTVSGSYVTARLIGNDLYLISQMPTLIYRGLVVLPCVGNAVVPPTNILYFGRGVGYTFTTILALDTDSMKYRATVLLLSRSSRVYVSTKNIYILSTTYLSPWTYVAKEAMKYLMKYLPPDLAREVKEVMNKTAIYWSPEIYKVMEKVRNWFNKLPEKQREAIVNELGKYLEGVLKSLPTQRTKIYRFEIEGLKVVPKAEGEVPGVVLDQFSMDEYGKYFRIATTVTTYEIKYLGSSLRWYLRTKTYNNVYVLNMNLSIVGKLEGLAIGERVYAARYLGNLMYLVTYRRVDPLFGIDLSDPKHPKVIGFLKIPGYSEYLHPYMNNTYLIGIGLAGNEEGRGVKVALFDIRDPRNIKVVSEVIIRGAYGSPLFYDHRAFIINTEEGYIAFPIYGRVPGLAVITLKDHVLKYKGIVPEYGCYRGLYIGNTIYAISYSMIKAVKSSNLELVSTLSLGSGVTYTILKK